ncbi:putative riboflavin kinase [Thermoascus aurantiacus ATCC 26904]
MRPDGPRDPVAGPESGPEPPFPIRLSGPVIKGFGRGSKELGIPTANIPPDGLSAYPDLQTGVYYGVVALDPARFAAGPATILPAVLSIGYNPFYKNTVRSVEIHILPPLSSVPPPPPMTTTTTTSSSSEGEEGNKPRLPTTFHKLPDFYGTRLNLLILGYIRPEYDYVSLEALVDDIRIDCDVARRSLARPAYVGYLDKDGQDAVSEKVREGRAWLRTF